MSKPFNLKRVVIVSFIVLLAALFALEFGPGSRRNTVQEISNEVLAHVGNKKITMDDILKAINPEMEPLLRNPELATLVEGYYLNMLEQLVESAFLEQQAPREGIAISNAELLAHLQQNQAFHKDGQFDAETYQRRVHANTGLTTVSYEKELRANIARYKLQQFLRQLSHVSDEETHAAYVRNAHKAELRFVRFSPAQMAAQMPKPTPKELDKFVAENLKALEEDYQKNIAEHMEPERLRLRHIFIERPADTSEPSDTAQNDTAQNDTAQNNIAQKEAEDAARKKAEALLASLQQGADFASLARSSSDDLETKTQGGDLGWVDALGLPPLLVNTVFGMKVGETSQLLETPRGYAIYRLEERSEAHPKPLQAVQQDIALRLWTQQKSEQQAQAEAKQALAALLQGKSLDALFPPMPAELGSLASFSQKPPADDKPTAVTTGLFSLNDASIPKLGDNSSLKNLLFQTTAPGPLPEIQTLGQDLLVVEVIERQTPTEAGFEQEKNNLRETLQNYRVQQTLSELVKQMKAKENLQLFPEKLKKLSAPAS
jgi:parvulin-like peptidyl-prolyl isomerase